MNEARTPDPGGNAIAYEQLERCEVCGAHLVGGRYQPVAITAWGAAERFVPGPAHICQGSYAYGLPRDEA